MIKTFFDLEVYAISYQLAMEVFTLTRNFLKEERYSLTDQIVGSSRSVAANIAEGWSKRNYENEFKRHLVYAMGSQSETKVWLNFAKDCAFLSLTDFDRMTKRYEELGGKVFKLYENWNKNKSG